MFKWISDENRIDDLQYQLLEKETIIGEYEIGLKCKDDKISRLEMKIQSLQEANQELKAELRETRIELMKCSRSEKTYSMMLMCSWIIFVIVCTFIKKLGC